MQGSLGSSTWRCAFLGALVALSSCVHSTPVTEGRNATSAPKHVILMVLDDIGWADVGYHGSDFLTPNIDKMVNDGVKLERMYTYPQCSPTRSSVLTGRYSFRTGMQHFTTLTPASTPGLPRKDGTKTVAEIFQAGGYATHMVGKWHVGYSKWSQTPLGSGFDSFFGYLQGEGDYYNHSLFSCLGAACIFKENRGVSSPVGEGAAGYDFWDNRQPVYDAFGQYSMDYYDQKVDEILKPYGSKDIAPEKPLFLYFAEQTLHIPIQAPPDGSYVERCRKVTGGSQELNRTILCAMAGRLDDSIGLLSDRLKRYGMWNDTLILGLTDNGGMTYWGEVFPSSASSNWPLRGGKTTVFEGGVRSVAFLAGGAVPPAARGTSSNDLLHAIDVLPTLAGFAGLPTHDLVDGQNFWPTLQHGVAWLRHELPINIGVNPLGGLPFRPGLIGGGGLNYSALISWPYKIVVGNPYITWATADERRRDGWWTLKDYRYVPPEEEFALPYRLYDLEKDETEQRNLAGEPQYQDVVKYLTERVRWYASKANGYKFEQLNLPKLAGNCRWHNWTWSPFIREEEEENDDDDDDDDDDEVSDQEQELVI